MAKWVATAVQICNKDRAMHDAKFSSNNSPCRAHLDSNDVSSARSFKCKGKPLGFFSPDGELHLHTSRCSASTAQVRVYNDGLTMAERDDCSNILGRVYDVGGGVGKPAKPACMRPEKFTPGKKYDWLKVSMVSIICSGVGYEHPLTVPVPVTFKPAKTQAAVGSPKPDLFVTMLDSFSRPQFRDALNGTHNLLKHIAEKIPGATATELKHHHPTGGHTAPNLWAFWAGYRPNFDFMKHAWCGDRCEWMWQALMDVGYTTTMSSFTSNCHHVEYGKYADQNERTAMEKPAPTRSYKRGKGLDDHGLGMWDRLSHLFEFERHLFGYYKENGWRNEYGVAINPYHDAPETNCVGPGITI